MFRIRIIGIVSLTVLLVAGAGCASEGSDGSLVAEESRPMSASSGDFLPYGTPATTVHLDARREADEKTAHGSLMVPLLRALDGAPAAFHAEEATITERLRASEALLAEHRDEPVRYLLEQAVALHLYRHLFADGQNLAPVREGRAMAEAALSEVEVEALGFAASLLLQNRNPNADLIAAALHHLEGRWSEARRRAAAEQATADASSWLGDRCTTCSSVAAAEQTTAVQARLAVSDAVPELQRIASR